MTEITKVLERMQAGDSQAAEQLLAIVYDELKRIAASRFANERKGHTLQTTALVHEAYMRLIGPADRESDPSRPAPEWHSRGHFFCAAAEAMRRILIDHARGRNRQKRGGDRNRVDLELADIHEMVADVDLEALDEALDRLESHDKIKADVVKLRYFAGMTIEQTAAALGVSEPTVKRYWFYSRAWLRREIGDG